MVNSKLPSHGNAADDENPYSGEVLRIAVKQIAPGDEEGTFSEIELDEIVTAKWEQGWIRLNVTAAFRKWTTSQTLNYGLVLSTKRADNGEQIPMSATGLATIMDKEEHQPFLVAFLKTNDGPKKPPLRTGRRVIRSVNRERRGKKSKKQGRQYDFTEATDRPRSCQMGMLYVNFEDLGWKDWVIAPDGFIAYYCHGECSFPLTASMNATNHAIVSTLVHTYYPLEYPRPSCAPVKLGSISMLYYDDNSNVTVKKYKEMTVKSCGCK
jgi:bone morphogenetic protein 7